MSNIAHSSVSRSRPNTSSRPSARWTPLPSILALLAALLLLSPRMAQPPASPTAASTTSTPSTTPATSATASRSSWTTSTAPTSPTPTTTITTAPPKSPRTPWSVPGHTNVHVFYQAVYTNNSGWSAYTAIPTGPIAPTQGHQFTNPGTNFGGEHFGVGYRVQPTKVLYYWLLDSGNHTLLPRRTGQRLHTDLHLQPAGRRRAGPAAAVIPAPVPIRAPSTYEFSDASWVKVITTTSHTNTEVRVSDLMTPDPNDPTGRDWRNGQTNIEVETEWQLLQIDYNSSDYNPTNGIGGPNGQTRWPRPQPGQQR